VFALEPYPTAERELWTLPPTDYVTLEHLLRERADLFLARAAETLEDAGIAPGAVATKVVYDSPRRAILEEAAGWGADLIVLGSHGYGVLRRFLLGSVAITVAEHAHCSVEIVRPKVRRDAGSDTSAEPSQYEPAQEDADGVGERCRDRAEQERSEAGAPPGRERPPALCRSDREEHEPGEHGR
jgi:nucleotide-binding universal stress UspA family protein